MTTDKMLIDAAHPEETRVVVLRGNRIEEFDYESAAKKLLRGNIYLAKITRVEPSLQAAFVDYGGNRHGFLAFSEIHPDYYQIPVADRQALLREEAEAAAEEARREANEPDPEPQPDNGSEDGETHDQGATEIEEAGGGSVPWDIEDAGPMPLHSQTAADPHGSFAAERHDPVVRSSLAVSDLMQLAEQSGLEAQQQADSDTHILATPVAADVAGHEHAAFSPAPADGSDHHAATDSGGNGTSHVADAPATEETVEESPERRRRPRRASYKIQEVIKRRQIILVQVVKEERGNKGAALTTYLSLAGRYTVLMPNTARGGGISRKITNAVDRRRLKEITSELEVPDGMGLIVRTAGASRATAEIKRDHDYLLRLWESVRDLTLKSSAPALVYEEGSLVKRSIRDLYSKEIEEVVVAGQEAYESARDFMRMLMPSHAKNVKLYEEAEPLFARYQIERQLNAMYSPYVTLKSGGYIVLNQTEALVAIDVNSGKSTREHNIEDTALNTNLEACDEVARQLRLRDLAGLIVIDFIDMDERRNNRSVERRLKDALRFDRARIQVGRISHFGLMEMSRQRLRTGVLEGSTSQCPHCMGTGVIRSTESVALAVLRALEDNLMGNQPRNMVATTSIEAALYLLNEKRAYLRDIEARYGVVIEVDADAALQGANFRVDATGAATGVVIAKARHAVQLESGFAPAEEAEVEADDVETGGGGVEQIEELDDVAAGENGGDNGDRKRSRRRRRRKGEHGDRPTPGHNGEGHLHHGSTIAAAEALDQPADAGQTGEGFGGDSAEADDDEDADAPAEGSAPGSEGERAERRGRRRGRRGGRRNRRSGREGGEAGVNPAFAPGSVNAEQPDVQAGAWENTGQVEFGAGHHAETIGQASPSNPKIMAETNGHLTEQAQSPAMPIQQHEPPFPVMAANVIEPHRLDDAANAVGSVFRHVSAPAPEPHVAPPPPMPAAAMQQLPPEPTAAALEPFPAAGPPKRGWWTKRFTGG